ncbi:hypothetical protein E3N88_05791 [Mikania micrantha]|uniref:Uncharacterized protein n=1 Tax=Mikania micrantha TaxID=192012 RepID=A0A5N6PNS6_9ASTR|nr:hypothetical protein E3N88_05791 [Mikania micrantha]
MLLEALVGDRSLLSSPESSISVHHCWNLSAIEAIVPCNLVSDRLAVLPHRYFSTFHHSRTHYHRLVLQHTPHEQRRPAHGVTAYANNGDHPTATNIFSLLPTAVLLIRRRARWPSEMTRLDLVLEVEAKTLFVAGAHIRLVPIS